MNSGVFDDSYISDSYRPSRHYGRAQADGKSGDRKLGGIPLRPRPRESRRWLEFSNRDTMLASPPASRNQWKQSGNKLTLAARRNN